MIGHLILRLSIWFLLTNDFSWVNIVIGVIVALLLPRSYTSKEKLKDWLKILGKIFVAIPQAYIEAIEIIFRPHLQEDIVIERVNPERSPRLVFLDIFLITFTPKTIVLRDNENGSYEVHLIRRRLRK
jgi:multicomponent Na+:H+ antiporter subunit E